MMSYDEEEEDWYQVGEVWHVDTSYYLIVSAGSSSPRAQRKAAAIILGRDDLVLATFSRRPSLNIGDSWGVRRFERVLP